MNSILTLILYFQALFEPFGPILSVKVQQAEAANELGEAEDESECDLAPVAKTKIGAH